MKMIPNFKLMIPLLFIIVTAFIVPQYGIASTIEQNRQSKAQRVLNLADDIDNRTSSSVHYEKQDRNDLQKELKRLQNHLNGTQKKHAEAKKELTDLSARRAQLGEQYQHQMADMKTVEGIFRTAIAQSLSRFEHSPVSSHYPERLPALNALAKEKFLLEIKDMRQYSDILFADMVATRMAEMKSTQVIGLDGHSSLQNVYRAGGFFLGYQERGHNVFALPQGELPPKSVLSDGVYKKVMASWFSGESEILPIDITGGTAFRAIQQKRGPKEWMEAGGVLLYPILLAGIIGALVALFKTIHLSIQKVLSEKGRKKVFSAFDNGEDVDALLSKMHFYPAARVMRTCLAFKDRGLDAIDSSMEESILREQSRLERFLSSVGVLASISPLLGLLGTVTGMIDTFQAITIYGTGDPRMMSTGISEALVTTQAGLGVALPLLLAHHFLKRRVVALVANMEEIGNGVTALLSTR